eukprot:COSAG01_NODE_2439_length_7691_cov_15.896470_6_plen_112_part_00
MPAKAICFGFGFGFGCSVVAHRPAQSMQQQTGIAITLLSCDTCAHATQQCTCEGYEHDSNVNSVQEQVLRTLKYALAKRQKHALAKKENRDRKYLQMQANLRKGKKSSTDE